MAPEPVSTGQKRLSLGEYLIKEGLLTADQLKGALADQKKTGELLGRILVMKKLVSEETLARILTVQLSLDYVDLMATPIPPEVIQMVPEAIARKEGIFPVGKEKNTLFLAMSNPQNTFVLDELRKTLGCEIEPRIATLSGINYALEKYYGSKSELKEILSSVESALAAKALSGKAAGADAVGAEAEAPVIQFVDQLLLDAVKDGTSDIHIEPCEEAVTVRFRVDGVLHDIVNAPTALQEAIVSRVKIISNLDISEKRIPQDGRFERVVQGNTIDVRVSVCPTVLGEKVVMRLLNRGAISLNLKKLGFSPGDLTKLELAFKRSYGILLITGPTGSGKTSSLYCILEMIKSREKNLVTIEDPVEYHLGGIAQSQVNPKTGVTFAALLRSLMRQDPDVILVGEIRDAETAEVAIRASLTGHLVLSTLHTNDAPGAVTRLVDMGVEPFLVASSLIGIVGQRLIRTICLKCKSPAEISPEILKEVGLPTEAVLYQGRGCEYCLRTGYRGRCVVSEILLVDEEIRVLITGRVPTNELRKMARQKGMQTLREDAISKALQGLTTLSEVMRVTDKD